MGDVEKPKDLLITYSVSGPMPGFVDERVEQALRDGYRIIDVMSTATGASVIVTAVLTLTSENYKIHSYLRGNVREIAS
jgi:hypothetical protein